MKWHDVLNNILLKYLVAFIQSIHILPSALPHQNQDTLYKEAKEVRETRTNVVIPSSPNKMKLRMDTMKKRCRPSILPASQPTNTGICLQQNITWVHEPTVSKRLTGPHQRRASLRTRVLSTLKFASHNYSRGLSPESSILHVSLTQFAKTNVQNAPRTLQLRASHTWNTALQLPSRHSAHSRTAKGINQTLPRKNKICRLTIWTTCLESP